MGHLNNHQQVPLYVRKTEPLWHAECRRSSLLPALRGKVPTMKSFLSIVIGTFNKSDQAVTRHIVMIVMANSKTCSSKAAQHHGCSVFRAHLAKLSAIKLLSLNARFQFNIKKNVYLVILRSDLGLRGSSNTWKFCFLPWWSFKAAQLSQITQVQPLQLNSLSTPKQVL